jgi:hypothetical protein
MGKIFLIYLFAYIAGSVNFAIIFFKLTGREDPRLSFSGNAGTTNVYRQAGYFWATVILLLDIGRALGVAAVAVYFFGGKIFTLGGFFSCFGEQLSLLSWLSRRQRRGQLFRLYSPYRAMGGSTCRGDLACCLWNCPDYFHCFIFHDFYFSFWTGLCS